MAGELNFKNIGHSILNDRYNLFSGENKPTNLIL